MTETYGVLTVGSVISGAVAVGEKVTGAGVLPMTAIDGNLSGSGPGSTWLVNNSQTVGAENLTMTATPLVVNYKSYGGATSQRNFFEFQPNGQFGYDYNPSTLSYMSGTAAAALGLTLASGALDSITGGAPPPAAVFMNNLVQNEYGQFGSYQATWQTLAELDPKYLNDLAAWAQSTGDLYTFLNQWTNTTPQAGSSTPMTDPAGTYSGPGARRADARAAFQVRLQVSGRAGITSRPPGPAAKTPDDPNSYTPYPGATEEIKLPPMLGANGTIQLLAQSPWGSAGVTDMTQITSGRGNPLIDQNYAGARLAPSYFDDNIASGLLLLLPAPPQPRCRSA